MKMTIGWIGLIVAAGVAGSAVAKEADAGLVLDQVVFSDNFDSYPAEQQLSKGGKWTKISAKPSIGCSVMVKADAKNIFGGSGNQYLQMSDDSDKGSVRALAEDIPGFSAKVFRVSFDLYEPNDGRDGSFGIKAGIGEVSKKDQQVVNGVQVADGRSRPGQNYSLDAKHHFDLYINETDRSVKYVGPDGEVYRLKSGDCAVWIDGDVSAKGANMHRALKESVPATSLMLSSYSTAKQELWLDNIEIAVAQ